VLVHILINNPTAIINRSNIVNSLIGDLNHAMDRLEHWETVWAISELTEYELTIVNNFISKYRDKTEENIEELRNLGLGYDDIAKLLLDYQCWFIS